MFAGQRRPLAQQGAALARQQGAPADEGFAGRVDRTVDPLLVAMGDFGDDFVGCRVGDSQASFAVHPLAIDVGTGFQQIGAMQLL
ncbi:hypothetical protein D9M69_461620 [compost metagenome]